jgi:hypothetical protein
MEAWEMLDAIQRSWVPEVGAVAFTVFPDYVDPWWRPASQWPEHLTSRGWSQPITTVNVGCVG